MSKSLRIALPVLTLGALLGAFALLPGAASAGGPHQGEGTFNESESMDFGGVTVYYAIQNWEPVHGFDNYTVQVYSHSFPVGVAVQEEHWNPVTNEIEWVTIATAGDEFDEKTARLTFPGKGHTDRPLRFIFVGTEPGYYWWDAY